jgi:hypothetical protein
MAKIYSGKSYRQEMFAPPDIKDREELRKIEQLLGEVNREFEELQAQIALPEQSLGYLEEIMREPEKMLFAHTQRLRLNWMGVRVDNEPDSEGSDIELTEFCLQEELRRSAVLVSFSLEASQPHSKATLTNGDSSPACSLNSRRKGGCNNGNSP